MQIKRVDAFSLVELSVVLVILGLLVGGVLTGQNLVRAAELRNVTEEEKKFVAAVQLFKEKYSAFPGDMANATSYWGRADTGAFTGQCAAPDTNQGTGVQTCNGSGDGRLLTGNETFRFWQHMANAGLIEGNYTGIAGAGGAFHSVRGTNIPKSKLEGAGWFSYGGWATAWAGDVVMFSGSYGDVIVIGGDVANSMPYASNIFSPDEAWSMDSKIDDGKPGQGDLRTYNWPGCTNAANKDDVTTTYKLTVSSKVCSLFFVDAY